MSQELDPDLLSKKFFGRTRRVTVWGAILETTAEEPYEFRKIDLMMKLRRSHGMQISVTQAELDRMEEFLMIKPSLDHPETHWQRTDSPLWRVAQAAVEAWAEIAYTTAQSSQNDFA